MPDGSSSNTQPRPQQVPHCFITRPKRRPREGSALSPTPEQALAVRVHDTCGKVEDRSQLAFTIGRATAKA